MKLTRSFFAATLIFSLSIFSVIGLSAKAVNAQLQDSRLALQRGYRTGYSDGYMAGYRDSIDNVKANHARHSEYGEAKRAYNKDYGLIEDYQDGYRQGFEIGYKTGFDKSAFEASIPANISKRGAASIETPVQANIPSPTAVAANTNLPTSVEPVSTEPITETVQPSIPQVEPQSQSKVTTTAQTQYTDNQPVYQPTFRNDNDAIIIIPRDTELVVELTEKVDTESSRVGDKFVAKVVSPVEIEGALIEGRVTKITKPGRIKRRSELNLSFDRIVLTSDRWANFNAVLMEVMPVKGDNVKTVDTEGTAIGKSSLKGDMIKVGATTGTGLVIGAVAGGPVGAAVGAGIGAAFGVGAVVVERGKHVQLNQAQQLRVKTAYETQIR